MPLDTLRAAAESGTAAAQGALGIASLNDTLGVATDVEAGLAWLREAAAQGLLPARSPLGNAALRAVRDPGADSATRYTEALEWYRPLAEAGDAGAMYNAYVCCMGLARVCGSDGVVASHVAEAGLWLRGAAVLAAPFALNELGAWRWIGCPQLGVTCDRAEARRLFAAADAAGVPEEARARRPAGAPGAGGSEPADGLGVPEGVR
jgi:TPR repeat protein